MVQGQHFAAYFRIHQILVRKPEEMGSSFLRMTESINIRYFSQNMEAKYIEAQTDIKSFINNSTI